MKLLFVDHAFHQKTRSSEFFKDFLKQFFSFEEVFVDPQEPNEGLVAARSAQADIVLVWQLDFLAPIFLAAGCRTVVVPMYDGSANMPDLHWVWAHRARFINFSRRLHDRIRRVGGASTLVKYFPAAQPEIRVPSFDKLHVFLWQRRPEEGINVSLVERLLGERMTSLHVHNSPDNPTLETQRFIDRKLATYEFTSSKWFNSPQKYLELLDEANVFIAPRRSEGIGLATIEAMGRGMVVLACDYPVYDEYISNWTNGILFNADTPGEVPLDRVAGEQISRLAWHTVVDGHNRWRESLPGVLNYIRSTPKPDVLVSIDVEAMADGLCRAYLAGDGAYATYLFGHTDALELLTGKDVAARIDSMGHYSLDGPKLSASLKRDHAALPWLSQNRLNTSELLSGLLVTSGTLQGDASIAWIANHQVTLEFRVDPRLGATDTLQLDFCCPPALGRPPKLCLSLNGWTVWNDRLVEMEGRLRIPLPPQSRGTANTLVFQLNDVAFGHGSYPVSLGIREIAFV